MYFVALLMLVAGACTQAKDPYFQGYAEGEYVRVASPLAGTLTMLSVQRGMWVDAGAPLFELEQERERAARQGAQERLKVAQARLENLKKGKRPSEVAAVDAQLAQARASLDLAELQLRREKKLAATQFVSKDRLDELRVTYERSKGRVEELIAEAASARLAARVDEIVAATAEVGTARAELAQAEWNIAQKTVSSPVAGEVADHIYVPGDWVAAGQPIVSLLPPQNIKVRFFVPEPDLGRVHIGQELVINCDGCAASLSAKVSFIATQPEYTPPVIYSLESRAKLVYLIEARLEVADAVKLHPGQPVDVRLKSG